jgi:hypothetical protein
LVNPKQSTGRPAGSSLRAVCIFVAGAACLLGLRGVMCVTSFALRVRYSIVSMGGFSILTNRKRALLALAHSVVFLLIAVRQMVAAMPAAGVWMPSTVRPSTWILCAVFALVSAILFGLLMVSRGWMEKIYFAFCTASASSGFLRTAAGDQAFHAGIYIRVLMLVSAVLVGLLIVRRHSPRDTGCAVGS